MDKRIHWIDAAKGLGIILVVMSHAPINPELKAFLFAFHMPLFFYLSGAVFKPSKQSFGSFIKKKARGLLFPYFLFSAMTYITWFFIFRHLSFTPGENVDPLNPFTGIFLSTPENYQLTYNPAIWFLTCLFLVELLFFFYHRVSRGKWIGLFLMTAAGLGYASTFLSFSLPWNGFVALTAVVFYGLGFLTKHLWKTFSWKVVIPLSSALFTLMYFIQSVNERIDMRGNILGEPYVFYPAALLGMIAFLFFIQKVQHSRWLLFLGSNSIVILLVHMPLLNTVRALMHYGFGVNLDTANTLPWTFLFTGLTLALTIPFIYFFNNHPWFLGKKHPKAKKEKRPSPRVSFHEKAVP
ncbi:acyltransferase family protein [Bacillus sp. Marseille-P3800]|uniref:acyltransferase family protein n=1 Tax=Bacillus sp. Marseille-P3800 TaxID=2014782 RepID=UPI000C07EABF|nr:acyltransferase family protein [Bacillus sp. Marseille-P3800]